MVCQLHSLIDAALAILHSTRVEVDKADSHEEYDHSRPVKTVPTGRHGMYITLVVLPEFNTFDFRPWAFVACHIPSA